MKGIHVVSTAPFFAKNPEKKAFSMDKSELYCLALSALCWRKYNGGITLFCDKAASEYFESAGLNSLWDAVSESIPDETGIDPLMFWAGGKLIALSKTEAPVALIDNDFIVWKTLELDGAIVAAHRESITEDIYPDPDSFRLNGFSVDRAFSREVLPLNTAFLYLPDESFKQYYVSQSIAFMRSAEKCGDYLCYMVFAEQRLLAMCADRLNRRVETLLDKDRLFVPQDKFTHLWGAKQKMRDDPALMQGFIEKAKKRLQTDFPDFGYIIDKIERL